MRDLIVSVPDHCLSFYFDMPSLIKLCSKTSLALPYDSFLFYVTYELFPFFMMERKMYSSEPSLILAKLK